MTRLIDADALGTDFCDGKGCNTCTGKNKICIYEVEYSMKDVFLWLEQQPTIDAEPVVRCKDCEHWDVSKNEYSICCHAYHNMMMVRSDGMGFCSDGERKDNE